MKKYQTGINETVFEIIKQSRQKDINLPYITRQQIVAEFKHLKPEIQSPEQKIGQALYHLQKKTKFRRPRVKRFFDKKGKRLGWTVVEEEYLWKK